MTKQLIARLALFIVYVWFGFLKVIDASPANPLVAGLLEKTLPFITFEKFIVIFGLFEVLLGLLFLSGRLRKLTFVLFGLHMIAVFAPLILLPAVSWQSTLIPTLEGQYIIKNVVLIALVLFI